MITQTSFVFTSLQSVENHTLGLSNSPFPKATWTTSMEKKKKKEKMKCQGGQMCKGTLSLSLAKLVVWKSWWALCSEALSYYTSLLTYHSCKLYLLAVSISNSQSINLNVSVWLPHPPAYLSQCCCKSSGCSKHPTNACLLSSSCLLPLSSPANPARKSYILKFTCSIQKIT